MDELSFVLTSCAALETAVTAAGQAILGCLGRGRTILTCGNAAADALHLSEELVGRCKG